jgi:hypothetical protein
VVTCTAQCDLNACNRLMQSESILWKHASVRASGFVASRRALLLGERRGICA